ncbi:MAG: TonB-dependent receptor plug domain-containing protein [Thermoanaerobaculia bacterium]
MRRGVLLMLLLIPVPGAVLASDPPSQEPAEEEKKKAVEDKNLQVYDEIQVIGRASDMVGVADSASEGVTGREQLEQRPILRPGELLETVPGVIITQHSGSGKANQYFLRGFNLDHGTDFRVTVDNIPVNMPSHGHGQGYSDLNFLIPELVETVRYKEGCVLR